MSAVNKHIISGRVGKLPELRYTPNSTAVSSFSVARQPRHQNKATGAWEDGETTWYDVTVFNRLAENVVHSLTLTGIEVTVIGDLKKRSYTAKDGTQKETWELVADDVTISLDHQVVAVTDKSAYGNKSGGGSAPAQRNDAPAVNSAPADEDAPF